MMGMIFRVRYYPEPLAGAHVHCRLFAGPHDGALGKCGDLTMRHEEFRRFMRVRGIEFEPEAGASRITPWEGLLYPGSEETAAHCIEPLMDNPSRDGHPETYRRIIVALQDAFDLGVRAAGGAIFEFSEGVMRPDGPTETERRRAEKWDSLYRGSKP